MYNNDLIVKLKNSGYGCYLVSIFMGCLYFADDKLLISASIWHLRCMLNICKNYRVELNRKFNQAKSFLCQFSLHNSITLLELLLCGLVLSWVSHL